MTHDALDAAARLIGNRRFTEALGLLHNHLGTEPSSWNAWYLAGQCYRFVNDIDRAIEYLSRAADLRHDEPSIFLALGIALQQQSRWNEAVESFRRALIIDPDFDLAYNSLALTQKKSGEIEKALHNYDAGAKALARRIVKSMKNDRDNRIYKHRHTVGTLWAGYASYGALNLTVSLEHSRKLALPTGEMAEDEERNERHAGLYWTDVVDAAAEPVRLFLPNYFNTFRESLARDASYATMIGNRGTVLEMLGSHEEATLHVNEAAEFERLRS